MILKYKIHYKFYCLVYFIMIYLLYTDTRLGRLCFYLHIHSIYNRSYDWDALQKHSVKTEVDCMLDGSQKHSAHRKAQRFE